MKPIATLLLAITLTACATPTRTPRPTSPDLLMIYTGGDGVVPAWSGWMMPGSLECVSNDWLWYTIQ